MDAKHIQAIRNALHEIEQAAGYIDDHFADGEWTASGALAATTADNARVCLRALLASLDTTAAPTPSGE